jgi:AraC-like DNA-binding protein
VTVSDSILMAPAAFDHDRDTAAPSQDTASGQNSAAGREALLSSLQSLRLDGAIFFRAEFTESWAFGSPISRELAPGLRPGAQRLIMFHIVAAGKCWIECGGGERLWASEGDVIVLPYGDEYRAGGTDDATVVPIMSLLDPMPWRTLPVLRHGAGGARTDIVCGYLHSEHPLFNPDLRALPPCFVVSPPEGPAARWIRSSIDYALAAGDPRANAAPVATRLPELVLSEILRLHLASAPAIESGWLAALSDPVLAPALARLHAEPSRHWTVESLATRVAVSRSLLDERFRQVLGRSPIRYLTDWRMHLAEDLLASTDQSVAAVARRVGYDSEEAFSRAFKRTHALPPATWRQHRRTAA